MIQVTCSTIYMIYQKCVLLTQLNAPQSIIASLKYTFYRFFFNNQVGTQGLFLHIWLSSFPFTQQKLALHAKISNIFPSKVIRKVKVCNRMTDRAKNNIPPPWIFDLRSIKRWGVDCTCVLITILYISVGLTTCVSNCDQQLIQKRK